MTDFSKMTKAELVARLESFEAGQARAGIQPAGREEPPHSLNSLREAEQRMPRFSINAVEGIITIDERGLVELINPAAEKIFGYPAAEVVGRNIRMLMPQPFRREHDSYIANYLRTGEAKVIGIGRETIGQRKDGTLFPMDLSISDVRLGERRLFTGFVRDISEKKRAELRLKVQYATVNALAESNSLSEGLRE